MKENAINGAALLAISQSRLDELVEAYYIQDRDVKAVLAGAQLLRPAHWSSREAVHWLNRTVPGPAWEAWLTADNLGGADLLLLSVESLAAAVSGRYLWCRAYYQRNPRRPAGTGSRRATCTA